MKIKGFSHHFYSIGTTVDPTPVRDMVLVAANVTLTLPAQDWDNGFKTYCRACLILFPCVLTNEIASIILERLALWREDVWQAYDFALERFGMDMQGMAATYDAAYEDKIAEFIKRNVGNYVYFAPQSLAPDSE